MTRFMNAFTVPAIVLVLVQLSALPFTSASPGQAGHCNRGAISDQGAYTGPHNSSQGGGSLEDGSYQITIGGVALDDLISNSFIAGIDYNVRLETLIPEDVDAGYFKGLLIRLDTEIAGSDTNLSADYFTVQPSDSEIKKHPFCWADNIPAITHSGRVKKAAIEFTLNVPEPILGLRLDTTVVRNKDNGGSNWYYNKYNLDFSDPPPPPPCIEESDKKFYWKTSKKGKFKNKRCNWLAKKDVDEIEDICAMTEPEGSRGLAKDVCQVTCETCPSDCFQISSQKFFYKIKKEKPLYKDCDWLEFMFRKSPDKASKICTQKNLDPTGEYPPAMDGCPVTCGTCGGVGPQ